MEALELRDSPLQLEPRQLLEARRIADETGGDSSRDLWKTLNVVQENMVRGGVTARDANLRRRRTRAVASIAEDNRLNKALWRLAEELGKATTAPLKLAA